MLSLSYPSCRAGGKVLRRVPRVAHTGATRSCRTTIASYRFHPAAQASPSYDPTIQGWERADYQVSILLAGGRVLRP
ncbi:MAG TPA: hypothetical protein VEL31_06340 [Ktedonobacteraceae bacterium]|nr:hypothetical protein [Ktedonobacteraceae bacterium]